MYVCMYVYVLSAHIVVWMYFFPHYIQAYNKVKNNYSGAQGYCTVAFYLNIIAITSGTVLAIPFIGILLRVIVSFS